MNEITNRSLQENITEEIVLNLKTETCQFIQSKVHELHRNIKWQEFIDSLVEEKVLYYIDTEKVLQETEIDYMCKQLAQAGEYSFRFRVNYGEHFEWVTATIITNKRIAKEIVEIRIVITPQNLFNIQDLISDSEFLKEILLKGFGTVYSNMIWIDVNKGIYKIINQFGNAIDLEVKAEPIGMYEEDNKGYAINFVYKEDWNIFWKYTSLQWYREHFSQEGDSFSFLIRHIYNGEYRWVEVKIVCTKRDANSFHVFYWIDDVNDKVYDNTAMKDTLASVEVGQWRYEIKNGCEKEFTASPSLMRILGIRDSEDNKIILNNLKQRIYFEDQEKVKENIFNLKNNEETSFSFRLNNENKGLRYYRCGVTCIAKNDIYTCYQGYGQDVTDIMQPMVTSIKHAEELSFTDKLTGLHNRNYMESRCNNFMRKDELPVSMIMADCNYLKYTNDTFGHEYGDLLLRRVARSIQECLPDDSIAMRIGGDEFLIMCAYCTYEKATQIVDSIHEKLVEYSDEILKLSASFGIYTVENDNICFKDAYSMADHAMYEEKKKYHKRNANHSGKI